MKSYPNIYVKTIFWKETYLLTDGYFACSVGNVFEEAVGKDI